jgi:Na+-driven multidrug efflux pump
VFALDGVLIGAGDQRYLAWGMASVAVLFVAGTPFVASAAWLWALLTAFQVGRLAVVGARWTTPRWLVEGAP